MTDYSLVTLDLSGLDEITRIHMAAFPGSALTALGKGAVRRYYAWQLSGPHEVTPLGVLENARLASFCFGGFFRGAMSGFLRQNRAYLAGVLLTHPWFLVTNELIRERALFALKILRKKTTPAQTGAENPRRSFGILSIAVDPALQGRGYAKLLMLEEEKIAVAKGCPQMHLSVHVDNLRAIRFYQHLGWVKVPPQGAWAGQMVKIILNPPGTD